MSGGAELQKGGGLARAWTTRGPKTEDTQYKCPNEAPSGAEGTVDTEQRFCFVFAVASYLSFIHMKIEANLLKSVAYKTLDIHVPLFNPLLHALFYCKASN